MKSTVVRPSNGKTRQSKQRTSTKGKAAGGLRRLTKRQREKMYRIFVWFFLAVFTVSIVGGLIALTIKR